MTLKGYWERKHKAAQVVSINLYTACGIDLDALGVLLRRDRLPNEADNFYRTRLVMYMRKGVARW